METSEMKRCTICFSDVVDEKTKKLSTEKMQKIMENYHNELPSTITTINTTISEGEDIILCKHCLLLGIELTYQCDLLKKIKKEMANVIMSFSMSVVSLRSIYYFKADPTGKKIELEESHLPTKWFPKPCVRNTAARNQEQHTEEKITKRANKVDEESITIEHDVAEYVTVENDYDQILDMDNEIIPSQLSQSFLQDWEGIINREAASATSFDNDGSLFNILQRGNENEILFQPPNLICNNDRENELRMAKCRPRVDLISEEDEQLLIIPPGKIKTEVLLEQSSSQLSYGADVSYYRYNGYEQGTQNIRLETIKIEDSDSDDSTKKKSEKQEKENIMMSTCPANESGEVFTQRNTQFDKYKKINSQNRKQEDFVCKVCGKHFLSYKGLLNHKRIHVRVRHFKDLKWKLSKFLKR